MNRFAKIMQAIGWAAVALWFAVAAQGFLVAEERPELALHTVLALAAAAATVLSRVWSLLFLFLGAERFASAAARRARRLALATGLGALGVLSAQFALAGRLLWGSVSASTHAAVGAALVATHLVALVCERRALTQESSSCAVNGTDDARVLL